MWDLGCLQPIDPLRENEIRHGRVYSQGNIACRCLRLGLDEKREKRVIGSGVGKESSEGMPKPAFLWQNDR
jgi:hypothetical protein